jgi:dipeptidyl aminopeptidase/acylaminoacyl peptidase
VVAVAILMMVFTVVSVSTFDRSDRNLFGYRAYIVKTDSMSATDFSAGDLIFTKYTDPTQLQVGDIITFISQDSDSFGQVITHKIRAKVVDAEGNNGFITADNFKTQKQITDVEPRQREFNWGTVELVNWQTADDIFCEGLLFKPEDFDSTKKYPVMIYFYEKNSETLYNSRTPAPSRSVINIPYFVSNGYVVFVPDIYYKDGHPGQSAMRSIMPGVEMLEKTYPWIDGENMAIQGQSWGGYQVAYMVTQTGKFKAAGAGAPVSNMTSAYGGIRWGSGITRQVQYEQGQSRIGKDLWSGYDLYYENSPLFFVPNVTTPILIMHNDKDGAVPWYQGIEYFTALRRCGKVAWLLQYNNEEHNLGERRNAKDLSIRLSQFFDHYLKGAPMPKWMKYGRPATEKGIDLGYDLVK